MDDREFLITAGKAALSQQDEYLPTLMVRTGDGQTNLMVLLGDHPYNMMARLVPTLRDMKPTSLALTVDSYIAKGDDPMAIRTLFGGSLQAAFEAGTPSVSEALVLNIVTPDDAEVITMPYTRTPDGVVWSDDEHASHEVDGRMVDVMRAVWL